MERERIVAAELEACRLLARPRRVLELTMIQIEDALSFIVDLVQR